MTVSPKSTASPLVAIVTISILFTVAGELYPKMQLYNIPGVRHRMFHNYKIQQSPNLKSVEFPVDAIVTKSIMLPLVELGFDYTYQQTIPLF